MALSGVPRLRWRVQPERRERGASGTAVSVLAGLDRPDLTDRFRVGGRGEKAGVDAGLERWRKRAAGDRVCSSGHDPRLSVDFLGRLFAAIAWGAVRTTPALVNCVIVPTAGTESGHLKSLH